jgi:uncharacterized protein YaaQ
VATLLVGVDDSQVEQAIGMMRAKLGASTSEPRASLFVVPVERFEQV